MCRGGGVDLHAKSKPSAWEAQTMGRHWTKDGEECTPVAMTTTRMYRLDRGGSCVKWEKKTYPCYVRGEKNEMGSHK